MHSHIFQAVEYIVKYLELDQTSLRIGLSQIFFRTDTLVELEERVEEKGAYTFTLFQAHCRRYLWKNKLKDMEVGVSISLILSGLTKIKYRLYREALGVETLVDWTNYQKFIKVSSAKTPCLIFNNIVNFQICQNICHQMCFCS